MKVLIIEDNDILSKNINKYLEIENIKSKKSFDGKTGIYEASIGSYDAIILDLGLPDMDGTEVCKKLRSKNISTPILMLTARATTKDKIEGLNIGADDYLTKPFDYEELVARLRSLVRRDYNVKSNIINIKNLEICLDNKTVKKDGEFVKLTTLEFNLLTFLIQNTGKIFSKEELLEKVWGEFEALMFSRTVDIYIGYLRKKLGKDLIKTMRGSGYLIEK